MDTHDDISTSRWVADRLDTLSPSTAWQPDAGRAFDHLAGARQSRRRRRRTRSMAAAGLAIVCVCLAALPGSQVLAARCVVACVSQASRVGQLFRKDVPVAARASLAGAGLVGAMAPDFALTRPSGEQVTLSGLRGQVVLLNFWATWCRPCVVEMPWFMEFRRTYETQGLAVLGVSLDEDGWGAVQPFLRNEGIDYPVVIGDDRLVRLYGDIGALPVTFIIDRSGRITSVHVGLVGKQAYADAIEAALANR